MNKAIDRSRTSFTIGEIGMEMEDTSFDETT